MAQGALGAELRERLRDLANGRRRFGYRPFVLLRREGEPSEINGFYRLYREEGLTARKRNARRKTARARAPILVEARPDARWPLDLASRAFGSSMTNSPMAGASGCSTWSMASPVDTSS